MFIQGAVVAHFHFQYLNPNPQTHNHSDTKQNEKRQPSPIISSVDRLTEISDYYRPDSLKQ